MRSQLVVLASGILVGLALGAGCSAAHEMSGTDAGPTGSDGSLVLDTGGPVQCGAVTCAAGQVCCNPSCGICTFPGEGCVALDCSDAGPPPRVCGGLGGAVCAANELCDYPDGSFCGGDDSQGLCRPRPTDCPEPGGIPVCGCDGQDYLSECSAYFAGTDVAHTGSCSSPPPPAGSAAATATCAPWDGAAWRFAISDTPACGPTSGATLTIDVWAYLEGAAPGTTYTIGTSTSGGSQGQATACPGGMGPPCLVLTGTLTVESFTPSGTAVFSYSLSSAGGATYTGAHTVVGVWCASERFCG